MDPPLSDQSKHQVQDVSSASDPQESSVSVAQPEEPSAVSCDTNETIPGQDSKPIDTPVVDSIENATDVSSQPTDLLPSKPGSAQPPAVDDKVVAQQPLKFGPCSERHFPKYPRLSRDVLREIAAATLDALDDGFYYPPATKDDVLIGVEHVELEKEGKETEAVATKEEESKEREEEGREEKEENSEEKEESKKGEDGESEKVDKQPEAEVSTADEKTHSEVQEGVEAAIADHRRAGREPYDLKTKIWNTNLHTLFIAPDDETIGLWFDDEKNKDEKKKPRILIGEYSTLSGCRRMKEITQDEAGPKGRIGVLNYASAKKPGGGFLNGSQAQEESLARSSTLYPSLLTPTAKQFYRLYSADPDNAFYTHAMVYSPSVILFREDNGDWTAPVEVDILTSAAVNAGDVRKQVRWEEEMRALRERVRVAEMARRRELSLPTYVPTQVRIYEEEPQKDDAESGQPPLAQSEQPTSVQISPIIFASDPPSPPLEPLSLPSSDAPCSQTLDVTSIAPSHSPSSPYPHPPNVDPFTHAEYLIAAAMHERIARVLYLFQLQGAKHLVLGSFGTGVFQNSVALVAGIFRDLLCDPENENHGKGKENEKEEDDDQAKDEGVHGEKTPFVVSPRGKGRFKGVFDTVMFAILGESTVRIFKDVFEGAEGVEFDEEAGDVEGMKDAAGQVSDPPA